MSVEIVRKRSEIRDRVRGYRRAEESIGLVPTMGALHEGHLHLIRRSVRDNDRTVVTIFVNPLQFAPTEDLAAYPRDLRGDADLAEQAGADLIFAPSEEEMYRPDDSTFVVVEGLTRGLCGRSRPTHFRGVTTVVTKLFHIAAPDRAYFGQKDGQQARILRWMAIDLCFDLQVVVLPTVREADGLALSSRNRYLSPLERERALALSRSLVRARDAYEGGERSVTVLLETVRGDLERAPGLEVDYVELVDDETLEPVRTLEKPAMLAVAAQVGPARLIDNVVLGDSRVVALEE